MNTDTEEAQPIPSPLLATARLQRLGFRRDSSQDRQEFGDINRQSGGRLLQHDDCRVEGLPSDAADCRSTRAIESRVRTILRTSGVAPADRAALPLLDHLA